MAMNQDGGVLLKWQISIQLCVAEEIHPSWDPTWWKCVAALSPPPFGCSNMKSGDFLMLAYTSQPVIHLKQHFLKIRPAISWLGNLALGVPVTSHDHGDLMAIFTDSAEGSLDQARGRSLFSTEKWCWFFKSGNISTWFCHEYVIAKGTGLSFESFFGWKNLEDQSVGSVFLGQHEITRITRIGKGIFQKAGLAIQDFAEIWLLMVVVMMMFFAEPWS